MNKTIKEILIIFFISAFFVIINLFKLGERILSGDESRIIIKTIWILRGIVNLIKLNINKETFMNFYGIFTHTHVPMVLFLPAPFLLFKVNEFTIRFGYVLVGLLAVLISYRVISTILSKKLTIIICLFLSSSSIIVGWSRWADCPIIEIAMTGLLVYLTYLLVRYRRKKYYYALMIAYSISLFTIISYLAYLPIICVAVFKSWKNFPFQNKLKGLLIPICSAGLFYTVWLLISIFYLWGSLGLRYILFYRLLKTSTLGDTFIYFIKHFILDINILPWLPFIILGFTLIKKDKLVQIASFFTASYLIFFFILRSERPYLYNIYLPLIFIAAKGIKLLNEKIVSISFAILLALNIFLIIHLINGGKYPTDLVWSFGSSHTSLKEIGIIIRSCLNANDRYLSDSDYYLTDYYFNRHYPRESDIWGREKAIINYADLGVKAIVVSQSFIISHPELKYFLLKNAKYNHLFSDQRWLFLMDNCSIPNISNPDRLFDQKFGNINSITDVKR
jgi:hypothetical protein